MGSSPGRVKNTT